MNPLLVANFVGWMLIGLGLVQLVPAATSALFGESALPFLASAAVAGIVGGSIAGATRPSDVRLRVRDGFLTVTVAWLLASVFGALPYLLTGVLGPADAFFESVAGFTTTGSTVMSDVEAAPRGLLLWRAMTQWLGGLGIIVFAIALMPLLGVGGMQLFKAEMAGPVANKITPRVGETAKRLWYVYVGLTVTEAVLLVLAGLSGFDAICHALTTVSTGGFSTRNASVAAFDSPPVEWIVSAFMLLGGINFVLHYRVLTGHARSVVRDRELRYFLVLVTGGVLIISLSLWNVDPDGPGTVRRAVFQVVSVITTTGFASADFEAWPSLALLVLLQFMVMGAMAGSTSGGLKSLRTLIGLRALASVFVRQVHPLAVSQPTRYGGRRVRDDVLAGIWAFFTAYFLVAGLIAAAVAASGSDLLTAMTAALTTLGNVGPGLGEIGPTEHFGHFTSPVKVTLAFAMIAGRLELFTVLVLFHPVFWRR